MPKSSPRVGGLCPEGLWLSPVALPRHSLAVGPLVPGVVGKTFWALCSLGRAGLALLPQLLLLTPCRPTCGRTDRGLPDRRMELPLSLLQESSFLPDPQMVGAAGSGSH